MKTRKPQWLVWTVLILAAISLASAFVVPLFIKQSGRWMGESQSKTINQKFDLRVTTVDGETLEYKEIEFRWGKNHWTTVKADKIYDSYLIADDLFVIATEKDDEFYINIYDRFGRRIEHWGYTVEEWGEFESFKKIVVQDIENEYITLWVKTTKHLYAIESNPSGLKTWTVE